MTTSHDNDMIMIKMMTIQYTILYNDTILI